MFVASAAVVAVVNKTKLQNSSKARLDRVEIDLRVIPHIAPINANTLFLIECNLCHYN